MALSSFRPALKLALLPAVLMIHGCGEIGITDASRSTLVTGATVADGSGGPLRVADVRFSAEGILQIAEAGTLEPGRGETQVDGTGLVLAPGFIDNHSHHDGGLANDPFGLEAVSQGITTIVAGQDGGSASPLAGFFGELRERPVAMNVASYSGHNTIRSQVMGDDFRRVATPDEVERMRVLLEADMQAGALGLSSGLEYDPGIYSETDEVVTLATEASRYGGRYISHMRSEDRAFWDALDELITIGREARIPVQVSHMKLAMKSLWGRADEAIARMEEARAEGIAISADVYPYEYWGSTMTVLLPERDFTDRSAFEFALRELVPPEGFLIASFGPDPSYVGLRLDSIARLRGVDPVTAYMELVAESQAHAEETGGRGESMIGTSMATEDIITLLQWSETSVSTDGALAGRHPRGAGTYPKVLGRYVREGGELSLRQAILKMTYKAALNVGISGRGLVREGMAADLVLFDAETVLDRATPEDPTALSQGIQQVWVNGQLVYTEEGGVTGATPGQVILGPGAPLSQGGGQ